MNRSRFGLHGKRLVPLALPLAAALLLGACGDDDEDADGTPFELSLSPEFVQGAYPHIPVKVLVAIENESATDSPVELEASLDGGGSVELSTNSLAAGAIAEAIVTAPDTPPAQDLDLTLTVTAQRGATTRAATRTITVTPGGDDREDVAREILGHFTAWLQGEHPEMGITPSTAFDGTVVAPRLLVVSHYMFENEAYELGLSWHIMVAPDDWAELYVRPRDELAPTEAYRLSSWSTALAGGDVEFREVAPPSEVVR